MPNTEQPAAAENAVSNAFGHLDQDKLASIIADKFLTSEEPKAPVEEPEVQEDESSEESEAPDVVSEDSTESNEAEEVEEPSPEEKPEEDPEEDTKELPKGLKKRISKLSEKRKAAEAEAKAALEKVRALESELQAAKAKPEVRHQSALGSDKFAESLNTVDEVDRQMKEAIRVILATEQSPDGGVFKMDDGTEREISAEEIRLARTKAIELKDIYLPERKRYLEAESVVEQDVVKEYPWWKKPDSPEYAIANKFLSDFPEIKRKPEWKYIAGLLVEGVASKAIKQQAAKKTAPVVKKAPEVPRSAAPVAVDPKRSSAERAKSDFRRNPSSDNLAQLFKAIGI